MKIREYKKTLNIIKLSMKLNKLMVKIKFKLYR
jgi:hypothetical protein